MLNDANIERGTVPVACGSHWWAVVERDMWPEGLEEAIAPLWREPHGDRQVELRARGAGLAGDAEARDAVDAALRACVLDDEEFGRVEVCMAACERDGTDDSEARTQIAALLGGDPYSDVWNERDD